MPKPPDIVHYGGCHCRAVAFRVRAPARIQALLCNCSICSMTGYQHLIVAGEQFALLAGSEALTSYRFGTQTAQHRFCRVCGIKAFYVPRSHPDGFSVNVRCLDSDTIEDIEWCHFDGRNWQDSIERLRGPR